MEKKYLFLVSNLIFVLPVTASVAQVLAMGSTMSFLLFAKWFLFFSVGVRLFLTGLKQTFDPAFTAREIFGLKSEESYPVIQKLGFANLCFGLIGIVSLFLPQWRIVSAIGSGIYFLLAAILHMVRKRAGANETFALVTDVLIFGVLLAYVISIAAS